MNVCVFISDADEIGKQILDGGEFRNSFVKNRFFEIERFE
jgi:hypothetical protein